MEIKCKECGKTPDVIEEYIEMGNEEGIPPKHYVIREEGTLNRKTGFFYCTSCYIKIGMPLGTA